MVLIAAPMASSGGGGFTLLLPLILIVGMIWFMSRTQRKQKAKQAATVAQLVPGTRVITTSGQLGIVEEVDDEYVTLEISDGVLVQFVKQAIGRVLPDLADEVEEDDHGDTVDEDAADKHDKVDSDDKVPSRDKVADKPSLPPTHTEN
ncbi:MAG: preprotein translocase subunit YajC [Kribbellaceae bacterium]|jgi:preprotein translocase subunit YajC|nr:preprotein translocase subunit YajC [Kribbellaceae bacterium]